MKTFADFSTNFIVDTLLNSDDSKSYWNTQDAKQAKAFVIIKSDADTILEDVKNCLQLIITDVNNNQKVIGTWRNSKDGIKPKGKNTWEFRIRSYYANLLVLENYKDINISGFCAILCQNAEKKVYVHLDFFTFKENVSAADLSAGSIILDKIILLGSNLAGGGSGAGANIPNPPRTIDQGDI